MRNFNYKKLLDLKINTDIYELIAGIYEFKGRQELYLVNFPDILENLVEISKIQSTRSSNAIEGILTTDQRLKELVNKKSEPKNRNEEEIYGYREVLDIIHNNYPNIEFTKNNILTLHNRLYAYSPKRFKGRFKNMDNSIIEVDSSGMKKLRFSPISAFETEACIDNMICAYNEAVEENIPPLLLIPTILHDFLCIHPFLDGNGRISRLLTLLLLYKNGFYVGKYISLEMLIENTKDIYYESLQKSSENWHEEKNDQLPFIKYMLSIIYKAYYDLDKRFELISNKKLSNTDKIERIFENSIEPLTKSKLMELCPDISKRSIERALKNLKEKGIIKQIGKSRATKYIKSKP
ncbi:MAG: Fic family protein [Tissierellia bacterium]|nr:Fic family protein [Tissierellia bacterium]